MLIMVRELILLGIGMVFYYFLIEKRFSSKKTVFILTLGSIPIFIADVVLLPYMDIDFFYRVHILTNSLPTLFIIIYLSKHKGFKILFIYFTVSFLGILIELAGYFVSAPFGFSMLASIFGRLAACPIILFVILKVFRPLHMQMLNRLNKGWAIFCLIPLLAFILLYLLGRYPVSIFDRPENIVPMLLAVAITFLVYGVILIFFRQMQQQFDMQNEQQLLKLQVTALQNQTEAIWDIEEKTRILRHDMRHYVQNISTLLQRGDMQPALEFIGKTGDILEEAKITRYCKNPSVNAVLAYHLEAAKKEGISVKTRLDIPDKTPVDAMELSTVIANAIENARNACRRMPEGSAKSIELVCASKPHFVFECSNTFAGEVLFDKNGIPATNQEEHGIGTRSIAAFVKKHNALIDYKAHGGIFGLRILLN